MNAYDYCTDENKGHGRPIPAVYYEAQNRACSRWVLCVGRHHQKYAKANRKGGNHNHHQLRIPKGYLLRQEHRKRREDATYQDRCNVPPITNRGLEATLFGMTKTVKAVKAMTTTMAAPNT